jgi:hypothetical protein
MQNPYLRQLLGELDDLRKRISAMERLDVNPPSNNVVSGVLLVDANFVVTSSVRYTTITAALAACTGGETIMISANTYTEDITVADSNITLQGMAVPHFDSGTGRLVNGTIIRGEISLGSTVGTVIRDLGVDLVGVDSTDCISSSNTSSKLYRTFEHLVLLGNGAAALAHGLYGAGHNLTIHDVRVYDCYHGMAIHGSYVNISDVYFYRCYGTALIIKAKDPMTHVEHVNVSNVVLEGTNVASKRSGAVVLQSEDSLEVRYCTINNVTAEYCINGAISVDRNGSGAIYDCAISNVTSNNNVDLAGVGDFRFTSGDRITLTNCVSSNRSTGYAFQTDTDGTLGSIYLHGCIADSSGSGAVNGTFAVAIVNGDDVARGAATIASGAITRTARRMRIDTEAAAASDDLDTINGGIDGQVIILYTTSSSRDVTIKHNTGNIHCNGVADKTLGNRSDKWMGEYDSVTGFWEQLSYSDNF